VDWRNVRGRPAQSGPITLSPDRLRVLWRVERRREFRCEIITGAIYKHSHGRELQVFLGDENDNNLLHSELARFDFAPLDEKAADLRDVLLEKGWSELSA
jgi:hypothetical protein